MTVLERVGPSTPAAGARNADIFAMLIATVLMLFPLQETRAQSDASVTRSSRGLPGLVVTPSATPVETGHFYLNVNSLPDFEGFWTDPRFTLGTQHNGTLAFQLFSRLTVSAGVTDWRPVEPVGLYQVSTEWGSFEFPLRAIDLSANVQFLVSSENRVRPSLAVGIYDLTGTGYQEARYLVASKSVASNVRVSAGYGLGPDLLDGVFAGAEWRPREWASMRGEWDGLRFNGAVGLRPSLPGVLGRWVSDPQIDALWSEGKGWYWALSMGLPWDPDEVRGSWSGSGSRSVPSPSGAEARAWRSGPELAVRLAEIGLERVGVILTDSLVRVRYEDRVHLRSQADGLPDVVKLLAADGRGVGTRAEITLLSLGRPVLRVHVSAATLRALRGGATLRAVWPEIVFGYPDTRGREELEWLTAGDSSPSWLRADLVFRPTQATHLAWEKGLADARFGVRSTLEVPLRAGLHAAVGYHVPLWQSDGIVVTRGPLPGPSVDLALLGFVLDRSLTPGSALALHWSGGRFNADRYGLRQQAALFLRDGSVRLDGDVAAVRSFEGGPKTLMAIAGARWLLPDGSTRLAVGGGRYLFGDFGVSGGVSRFFGDTNVDLTVRLSEYGAQGSFRVTLPLLGDRSPRRTVLRPRMASMWSHGQNSTLFNGGGPNTIAFDIAKGLRSDFEAWDRFMDRDRLSPAALRSAPPTLLSGR